MWTKETNGEPYQVETTFNSQPLTASAHPKHPWHPPTWRVLGGEATTGGQVIGDTEDTRLDRRLPS
jgi:hypothetical protein